MQTSANKSTVIILFVTQERRPVQIRQCLSIRRIFRVYQTPLHQTEAMTNLISIYDDSEESIRLIDWNRRNTDQRRSKQDFN